MNIPHRLNGIATICHKGSAILEKKTQCGKQAINNVRKLRMQLNLA